MKSGFVSLIGRPNVGKSTLLNQIIGKKVAITSNKPQTTRNMIQGIYTKDDVQMVFVDTPGIHKPNHKLGAYLNKQAYYSIDDVDIILFLVDASDSLGKGDQYILERLKSVSKPVILVLNKVDKMPKEQILLKIDEYKDLYPFKEIVPLSALKNDNVNTLISVLENYLPDSVPYYEEGTVTNKSLNFVLSEMIREKVFLLTEEEVPHSVATVIDGVEKTKNHYVIHGTIIVDRDALKKIIVGHNGSMIKKIGQMARKDMEDYLGKTVYLELFVKTILNWRDREKYLSEFGYQEFE